MTRGKTIQCTIDLAQPMKVYVRDKRSKRPSLPEVKGTADDVMDEEEFR